MRRSRLLPLLAPALLVGVACTQMLLAHTTPLTSWKLGGFGMFSTMDRGSTRALRLRLVTEDGTFGVAGPPGSEWTRSWPRPAALRAEARKAACARWRLVPFDSLGTADLPSQSWETVYGAAALRAQTHLDGLAVPADSGETVAVVQAVRAEVVRFRLGDAVLAPRVLVTEAVDAEDACR